MNSSEIFKKFIFDDIYLPILMISGRDSTWRTRKEVNCKVHKTDKIVAAFDVGFIFKVLMTFLKKWYCVHLQHYLLKLKKKWNKCFIKWHIKFYLCSVYSITIRAFENRYFCLLFIQSQKEIIYIEMMTILVYSCELSIVIIYGWCFFYFIYMCNIF